MVKNGGDQVTHKEIIAYGNREFRSPLAAPMLLAWLIFEASNNEQRA